MRFPQTFIDDLKRQADIVRVVQDYVSLKKKGANWMACCPFHKEKTASFSVSPAKEIFYCFGCHKGGNVFNFVMEMERIAFPEAIKIVAEKKYDEVLGVHIVGPKATELISEAGAALKMEATSEELVRTIHAQPALSEAMHEAAEAVSGHALHI